MKPVIAVRDLNTLNRYRITDPQALAHTGGWAGDEAHGSFVITSLTDSAKMVVIASGSDGWDHVSVSRKNRPPNWAEMSAVHRMFFKDDEVAMQLHLPNNLHINIHPNVLHLWAPHTRNIPLPPRIMV
jgi:hypothetical protein